MSVQGRRYRRKGTDEQTGIKCSLDRHSCRAMAHFIEIGRRRRKHFRTDLFRSQNAIPEPNGKGQKILEDGLAVVKAELLLIIH
jgi:hypothetical protein